MNYGIQINCPPHCVAPNERLMWTTGYTKVPNHVYSRHSFAEQYISGVKHPFGTSLFPRFHIVKIDRKWYIHCDLDYEHNNIILKGVPLECEIRRLKFFFKYIT